MTLLRILIIFSLVFSCAPKKDQNDNTVSPAPRINCPESGDCSFEVMQNSSLSLKTDEFGKRYPLIEEGDKTVIRYHFKKRTPSDAMDASYSEYVLFEIEPGRVELSLRDEEMQQVKMTFGRICYCKGSIGYFPVTQGQLFIYQNKGHLQLRSSFKMRKIPQVVTEIDENIHYYLKN